MSGAKPSEEMMFRLLMERLPPFDLTWPDARRDIWLRGMGAILHLADKVYAPMPIIEVRAKVMEG